MALSAEADQVAGRLAAEHERLRTAKATTDAHTKLFASFMVDPAKRRDPELRRRLAQMIRETVERITLTTDAITITYRADGLTGSNATTMYPTALLDGLRTAVEQRTRSRLKIR
jgi:hypothetical protein